MTKFNTLMILPYLPLSDSLQLDNILIWSYKHKKDLLIRDDFLRYFIGQLLSCYKLQNGVSLDNPSIISVRNANFNNPSRKTVNTIEAIKNILLFAGVLEINSWNVITSDNFEVFYQRFNLGNNNIATQGGALHRITTGGHTLNRISFIKPEHINIPLKLQFNSTIVSALIDCYLNKDTDINKNQIIQSLNPFFDAYRNSHELSRQTRLLNLVMAFEMLFGRSKREHFRFDIERLSSLGAVTQQKYSYPIINTTNGDMIDILDLTYNQIWAEEFYKLRHRIIHGNTISRSDFEFYDVLGLLKKHDPHFYIAVNFYIVCVLNKLRSLGYTSIPHYYINSGKSNNILSKNISGIVNEQFQITRVI